MATATSMAMAMAIAKATDMALFKSTAMSLVTTMSKDMVMSIGMVGTLIGFLIVLTTTFTDIDTTSAAAMKEVIGTLASGMGIALMTSLIGLISSIILK